MVYGWFILYSKFRVLNHTHDVKWKSAPKIGALGVNNNDAQDVVAQVGDWKGALGGDRNRAQGKG
jgi:hypothetical protein